MRCWLHGSESTGPRTREGRLQTPAGAVARRRGIPPEEALELVRALGEAADQSIRARVVDAAAAGTEHPDGPRS